MKHVVDNFDYLAAELFKPCGGGAPALDTDEFYFVQILLRHKDGHAVNGNNRARMLRFHCVKSAERLLQLKPEIAALCDLHNARAYIHPTPRSERDVAALALQDGVKAFTDGNYHMFKNLYASACGKSFIPGKKLYVVDIDPLPGESESDFKKRFTGINDALLRCRGYGGENCKKVRFCVPTKAGIHLVTHPFDVGQFVKLLDQGCPAPDVHKNNPTLLYCSWED